MPIPFQTIQLPDQDLNRIQANISNALNSLNGPFIGGNLLTGISIGTAATQINHGLGRMPKIWSICDQDTETSVARTAWNSTSIYLKAGSACIISIWVN